MLNGKLVLGYSPIGNGDSIEPFDAVFPEKVNIAKGMDNVDAVIFWGGADIHPSLYNEKAHPYNQVASAPHPSTRDEFEWRAMAYCIYHKIPMIGVCRGAQLLCAKAGGLLVQDCLGHGNSHTVRTNEGEEFSVTSSHHQMMYPFNVEHELLAWTRNPLSGRHYEGANGDSMWDLMKEKCEPEIVYFPQIHALAIQGHPEWAPTNSRFSSYCNEQIVTRLLGATIES